MPAPLIMAGLSLVGNIGGKLIDKWFPDPEKAAQAKLELLRMEREGDFRELELQLSAIIAEAKSADPYTSRARPSFLYVVYILLLTSIPFSIVFALHPEIALQVVDGFKLWLHAIPEPVLTLFGIGYLGYTGARTVDKWKMNSAGGE